MKIVDLFSGTGGFSIPFNEVGYENLLFCEYESHARQVINKHWPNTEIFNDVTKLDKAHIHGLNKSKDELIFTGGFPCQDISIAGKNKGIENGEKSGLWREYKRLIRDCKPKYAVIENVFTLLSRGLNVILEDLAEIGYDATWTTIDTQWCGSPQRRRRVYILAVRDGIPAESDIFRCNERDNDRVRSEMGNIKESRSRNIKERAGEWKQTSYFTRQRSDQFSETGLSSTLAKRDYKSYTDLIIQNDVIRRVTPKERLLLQGYDYDFFDGCGLTNTQKFTLNGMSLHAVRYIAKCIKEFDEANNVPTNK